VRFQTPAPGVAFEIPDQWWLFADMAEFTPAGAFYTPNESPFDSVDLAEVQPPTRDPGTPLFKKYKLLPVLFAFQSPECALPLVEVLRLTAPGRYRFVVHNGFHRFYASAAAGYSGLPVRLI
jgi:hypothetical protein